MLTQRQRHIITEVIIVANFQKMISIEQIKNLLSPFELERTERDFLILEVLDFLSFYPDIKLVVHEYLIFNCENLAQ